MSHIRKFKIIIHIIYLSCDALYSYLKSDLYDSLSCVLQNFWHAALPPDVPGYQFVIVPTILYNLMNIRTDFLVDWAKKIVLSCQNLLIHTNRQPAHDHKSVPHDTCPLLVISLLIQDGIFIHVFVVDVVFCLFSRRFVHTRTQ